MNDLIKVTEKDGRQAVSLKELYGFLGLEQTNFTRWVKKNITENEFATENEDWEVLVIKTKTPEGGRPSHDFALTLDFAKRLAMMARTEKGEQARKYFIECEKRLKDKSIDFSDPNVVLALAQNWAKAKEELQIANLQIEVQAPKVLFADAVVGSETSCLVGELAKILFQNGINLGQNRLFIHLRENNYLGTKGEYYNIPNQKYIQKGFFEVKKGTRVDKNGVVHTTTTTKVTGAGQVYFINKFLGK